MKIRRGTARTHAVMLIYSHFTSRHQASCLTIYFSPYSFFTVVCTAHLFARVTSRRKRISNVLTMSDLSSVVSAAIALLSEVTKAQEGVLSYHNGIDEVKRVELDVELSRQKFQLWQQTWSGQGRNPDVKTQQSDATSKALWGMQGWQNVQIMLDNINRASKELETALLNFRQHSKSTPRTRWKVAIHALLSKNRSRPHPKHQELKDLAARLNKSIDELWLYTETVFDSLHGVMAQELRYPSRERRLASALQSRAGTLELYRLCANSTIDWSLEMDLLDADKTSSNSLHQQGNPSLHPFYHLFTQTRDDPTKVKTLVVENIPEGVRSIEQKGEVIQPDASKIQILDSSLHPFYQFFTQTRDIPTELDKVVARYAPEGGITIEQKRGNIQRDQSQLQPSSFQIFKSRSGTRTAVIPVEGKGSGSPASLRISEKSIADVHLRSSPETLASVLETLKNTMSNLSISEHFSIGAKVELAYKVVECGFFLLGTPWFSSLRSRNILRLKNTGRKRHSFILRIQTLDMEDLLFDDVHALTETSQLYRIGVLLMEIALDSPDPAIPTEEYGHDRYRTSLLPLIEQTMGAQYCKATAFCLQYRQQQTRFQGRSKYEDSNFQDWESYLAEFLQDYHSQVFLRLEELREIDTNSEYRSRKSWQTS